jgi:predicted site-specific integrase-resolvase
LYARVSTKKQLDDFSRQIEFIRRRRPEFSDYTIITDIASGINFKRTGISTILDECLQGTIGYVAIAYKDRLCRFGFELIVLDKENNRSDEQELSDDLLSIVQIFCCRKMGKRKYRACKTKDSENQNLSESPTEETN